MNRGSAIIFGFCAAIGWPGPTHLGAAEVGSPALQLTADPAGQRLACNEVEQRYTVNQTQLNSRVLNFLFFDAAERGCVELVRRFLDLGASIEARDRLGNTGLLVAARAGENQIVELLLAEGSAIEQQNLAGGTALLRAVTMNRRRTAKILLKAGADPNQANKKGVGPLAAAAFNGNDRLVRLLLDSGVDPGTVDATGKAPVVYAAAKGYTGIVMTLFEAGVDVNARYGNDLTVLMWAAGHGNDVPVGEGLDTVDLLLDRGARTGLADNRGRTALMIAAERGHAEVVSRLIEAGADPRTRDKDGKDARDLASNEAVESALGAP
jgi:ankyrin repeat protein